MISLAPGDGVDGQSSEVAVEEDRASLNGQNMGRSPMDLLKSSMLYRQHAAWRHEVLKHKWVMSEREGKDVGFDRAAIDFHIHHRRDWMEAWKAAGKPPPPEDGSES